MIVDFEQRESFPAAKSKKTQSSIFNFSSFIHPVLPFVERYQCQFIYFQEIMAIQQTEMGPLSSLSG